MTRLIKILIILAISTVKFSVALPLSFSFGLSFIQAFYSTTIGGVLGVFIFYFFSIWLIRLYDRYFREKIIRTMHDIFDWVNKRHIAEKIFPLHRKKFTKRNKLIIKIRRKWGFVGIILLTPVILSIPIGTFIITRYYRTEKNALVYLSLSVIAWSLIVSASISLF